MGGPAASGARRGMSTPAPSDVLASANDHLVQQPRPDGRLIFGSPQPTPQARRAKPIMASLALTDVREEPFPAPSKLANGTVDGIPTHVSCTNFADKILLTISQEGRLSQWVQVPLSAPSPALVDMAMPRAELSALPSTHLTPKTLLGGGGQDRETIGQLYAAQIASHLALRNPDDRRTLVVGLGITKFDGQSREAFFDVLELVTQAL